MYNFVAMSKWTVVMIKIKVILLLLSLLLRTFPQLVCILYLLWRLTNHSCCCVFVVVVDAVVVVVKAASLITSLPTALRHSVFPSSVVFVFAGVVAVVVIAEVVSAAASLIAASSFLVIWSPVNLALRHSLLTALRCSRDAMFTFNRNSMPLRARSRPCAWVLSSLWKKWW